MIKYSLTIFITLLYAVSTQFVFAEKVTNNTIPSLSFKNVIVPEAPPVASVMVAYLDITNTSNKKQTIVNIESPQFQTVEIHSMSMKNGIMNMQQLERLSIKPKQTVLLESGGFHIMLIRPIKKLKKGDHVVLTFKLDSGETSTIKTKVTFTE